MKTEEQKYGNNAEIVSVFFLMQYPVDFPPQS